MAELILFHHAQGLTKGVRAFADLLRAGGHEVTVPDMYEGATFETLEEGVAHAERAGYEAIIARGMAAAAGLPAGIVCAGFSLGALPAQKLAQTRPGVLGAILYHGGVAATWFGGTWPANVALQLHMTEHDPWCERDVAQNLVSQAADGELFIYPGSAHLVTDSSLGGYDPVIAAAILARTLAFLKRF
jgi:dienelactone hydrolase